MRMRIFGVVSRLVGVKPENRRAVTRYQQEVEGSDHPDPQYIYSKPRRIQTIYKSGLRPSILYPMATLWGYTEGNGPEQWLTMFPNARGQKQSPINIQTNETAIDAELKKEPLSWNYGKNICKQLMHTGHGWQILVDGEETELKGGPLHHTYQLQQFHSHWGAECGSGSEHQINGKCFSGELHFVHWNKDLYSSFAEAAKSENGLAVIAVFLKDGTKHEEFAKLANYMEKITNNGDIVPITDLNPSEFIPKISQYWTYEGSLTTPPCNESVTWIIYKDPIEIAEDDLCKFRNLLSALPEKKITNNYRPPQPLNNRVIKEVK